MPLLDNPSLPLIGVPGAAPAPPTPNTPLSPFSILRTVWLTAASNGGTGSGQAYDPWQVGTAAQLDAIFPTIPAFTRIIFAPGLFITALGLGLKDGQVIEGAGKGITFIRLANNAFVGSGQSISTIIYFGNTVDGTFHQVRGVTVDQNLANQSGASGASTGTVNAISLQTLNGLIEDVQILGAYANPGEGFPVSVYCQNVGTKSATNPAIGRIRRCEFVGNGLTSAGYNSMSVFSCFDQTGPDAPTYSNQWMTGYISECVMTNQPKAIAFGSGGWNGFSVVNNKVQNWGTFMVQDTHKGHHVLVGWNVAEDLMASNAGGAQFFLVANGNNTGQYRDYKIIGNSVKIKASVADTFGVSFFNIASPDMADLLIDQNIFDANGNGAVANYNLFQINTPSGGLIRNNRASNTYYYQSGAGGTVIGPTMENNKLFDGSPMVDIITTAPTAGQVIPSPGVEFVRAALNIDLKTIANTTIFTVPAGKIFVLTGAYLVARTVAALSAQANLILYGGATAMANLLTGTAIVAGNSMAFVNVSPMRSAIATELVVLQVNGGATATTFKADIYVRGFYLN